MAARRRRRRSYGNGGFDRRIFFLRGLLVGAPCVTTTGAAAWTTASFLPPSSLTRRGGSTFLQTGGDGVFPGGGVSSRSSSSSSSLALDVGFVDCSSSVRNRRCTRRRSSTRSSQSINDAVDLLDIDDDWTDVLPMEKGSHDSAKIVIPPLQGDAAGNNRNNDKNEEDDDDDDPFDKSTFRDRLEATVTACRELGKTSLWAVVPMSRAGLIEDMAHVGLRFHHAVGETATLNVWLAEDTDPKVPEFATHHVGVGAVVVNSRDEILCVREIRKNYLPWKTPTGLSELGEQIDEAAIREVWEETGIKCTFHSIVGFRHTHNRTHGRSDLFFVCRLDPVEGVDENGNVIIPEPTPEKSEIERAEWVPLNEYRTMVDDLHPMMKHALHNIDAGRRIEKSVISSVIPGSKPNAVYYPWIDDTGDDDPS